MSADEKRLAQIRADGSGVLDLLEGFKIACRLLDASQHELAARAAPCHIDGCRFQALEERASALAAQIKEADEWLRYLTRGLSSPTGDKIKARLAEREALAQATG